MVGAEEVPSVGNPETIVSCKTLNLKDGYYVGIAAGYDVYKMANKIIFQDEDTQNKFTSNPDLALNGMVGDFFLGYGKQFGRNESLYLGLELFANGSAADNDFQTNIPSFPVIIDSDMVVNGNYGLSAIPGLMINNTTMLFLKLGYSWSIISIDETVRIPFNSIEYTDEVTVGGFMYGIGLESALYDQFTLRAEYSHTDYNSFETVSKATVIPTRNQFLLGLVYHFYPKI